MSKAGDVGTTMFVAGAVGSLAFTGLGLAAFNGGLAKSNKAKQGVERVMVPLGAASVTSGILGYGLMRMARRNDEDEY